MTRSTCDATRTFGAALAALGLLLAAAAAPVARAVPAAPADLRAAFGARSLDAALAALTGGAVPQPSKAVRIKAQEIVPKGMPARVVVRTDLPDVKWVAVLVERNPRPLAALVRLEDGAQGEVGFRVRLADTSRVVALVRTAGGFHVAERLVKATPGGCGG